jgi:hypothetical protein
MANIVIALLHPLNRVSFSGKHYSCSIELLQQKDVNLYSVLGPLLKKSLFLQSYQAF